MLRMFWNSKAAMNSMQNKLEIISNNMSNVNTVGYKKVDMGFQELLQESLDRNGYPVSKGEGKNLQIGTGVKNTGIVRNTRQGDLNQTGNKTDFALDSEGFFKVYLQNNTEAYTRGGSFQVDTQGKLVDQNGNKVSIVDNNGREISDQIILNKNNFVVNERGEIFRNDGDNRTVKVGNLGVYDAIGNDAFKSIGENLYVPSSRDVRVFNNNNNCDVLQGYLEFSNVRLEEEMSDLIITQKAFQLNSAALKTADEMWGMANNLKR